MIGTTVNQYKILERLGAGGMGIVYKAEDTRLGRIVALKFLPPYALDSAEDRTRFLIEAQSAAALDHPNICTIHEIGDSGDHPFIVMAYVDGPSLKERLKDGPMDPAEAVSIAGQVASGLVKAHEKGIIHRDIKPANILLSKDGLCKICDFGLAKSSISKKVTRTGSTIGTAAYMSPEQARSEVVDQRTDIWSLGVILYEMLAGKPPFVADHEAVVIYSILNDECPPLEEKRPGLPAELYRIVKKALAHKAADRYPTIEEMRRDLKAVATQLKGPGTVSGTFAAVQPKAAAGRTAGPPPKPAAAPPPKPATPPPAPTPAPKKKSSPALYIVVGALTVAAVVAVLWFNMKPKVTGPSEETTAVEAPLIAPPEAAGDAETEAKSATPTGEKALPTVAVLPLENQSSDRDEAYFAAGMTQALTEALGRFKKVKVVSRHDAAALRGMPLAVEDFGRRLGADYLIEGSIRKDKKNVLLTTHLHRVSDRDLVWSLKRDVPLAQLFAVEGEIADSLAATLGLPLTPEEKRAIVTVGTGNAEAYDQYLRGQQAFEQRTEDDNEVAEKAFRRAISLDKDYAAAQIALARTLMEQIYWGWDDNEKNVTEAAGLLQKAAARDSVSAEYHAGIGELAAMRHDLTAATRSLRRAVQLAPQDPDMHYRLGVELANAAQTDEAARSLRKAIDLKSNFTDAYRALARVLAFTGKPGDAGKTIATALDVSPNLARVRVTAGQLALWRGQFVAADSQLQKAIALRPKIYRQRGVAGTIALFQRRLPEAVSQLKDACDKAGDWRDCLRLGFAYELTDKSSQANKAWKDAAAKAAAELAARPGDLELEYGLLYLRCLLGEVKDPEPELKRLGANTQKSLDPTLRYYFTAAIDAHVGMSDRAVENISRVLKMNVYSAAYLAADPVFEKLKNDSKFQKLVGATTSS
ncbi:MAG TPA: protein kinase [bacterium]|nr:protein kinase [bacterium]